MLQAGTMHAIAAHCLARQVLTVVQQNGSDQIAQRSL